MTSAFFEAINSVSSECVICFPSIEYAAFCCMKNLCFYWPFQFLILFIILKLIKYLLQRPLAMIFLHFYNCSFLIDVKHVIWIISSSNYISFGPIECILGSAEVGYIFLSNLVYIKRILFAHIFYPRVTVIY